MFQRLRGFYTNEPSVTSRTKLPTKHPTISNKCKATKYRKKTSISQWIVTERCPEISWKNNGISWHIRSTINFTKTPPWILKCLFCFFSKTRLPKLSQNWPWCVVRLCHMGLGSRLRIIFGWLGRCGGKSQTFPLEFEKIISKNPSKTIQTDILHKSPKLEWSALQLVDH